MPSGPREHRLSGGAARARTLAPLIAAAALVASSAIAVASVAYLPTHDGPQHIFNIHAANHLDAAATGWGRWLEPNLPLSSYGFPAVFGPLDAWLPWDLAARISLAVMVAAWVLGAFLFVRALDRRRSWLGVALGAMALQWTLYMGFFSFYIASAFGLYLLAVAVTRDLRGARQGGLLAVLLLLQALLHVAAAALTGSVVGALLWLRARPGTRAREAVRIAWIGAPAAALAAAVWWIVTSDATPAVPAGEPFHFASAPWWALGKCLMGGPAWRAWPLSVLAVAALGVAILGGWRRRSPEDRALLATGTLFLAASLWLPMHLESWHFFSTRFTPLAVCALVATLPIERIRAPRARFALAAALCAYAFASTGWAFGYDRALAARAEPALAGLVAPISRSGARLPIVLDLDLGRPFDEVQADMPYAAPLLNLGKLYATAQGGMVPYAFVSSRALHPVLLREDMKDQLPLEADPRFAAELADPRHAGDLALREAVTVYMAAQADRFEDVIFWGRPEDVDHLLWLGFHPDWRRGGLAIARFEGCPLSLRITPSSALGNARTLELGWQPALGTTHRYALARARHEPDGALTLSIRQSCGAVWIRFDAKDVACEGADAERRFVIPLVRATPHVVCRVQSAARGD
jgi:hypothetical protein